MAEKILLVNELLSSSSSSSDEEIMATLMKCETQIPKVKNMIEIINEYSDKKRVSATFSFKTKYF